MRPRSQHRRPRRRVTATLAVLVAATSLSACTEVEPVEKSHYSPAKPIIDKDGEIIGATLTQEGADRIEIATGVVGRQGGRLSIPYAALVYEPDGKAYVYANPQGLTYRRAHIEIDRVAGDRVLLHHGPPVGTKVVTTGAAQVHGAELEYGEY